VAISVKDKGWASKESQNLRNKEYGRKAKENASEIFDGSTEIHLKDFFFKVLTGSAQGILIGVLPSAVMKNVLKYSGLINTGFGADFSSILTLFQSFIPLLIGLAVAMQFKMKSLDVGVVAIATAIGGHAIKWATAPQGWLNPVTNVKIPASGNIYIASGAGDVINAMIVAGLAVLATWLVAKYLHGFGSVAIILSPIIIGGLVGLLGYYISPYVGQVTTWIGEAIANFTQLAPIPMSILIAMAFSVIIITPISTVGIALAISLAGIGSGAAGIGVAATTVVLLINSIRVNKNGVSVAILLGAMKGMMPSVFKKPITIFPFLLTAAISAIPVALFKVEGTPSSAGFGYIGLVSPLQSVAMDAPDQQWMTNLIGVFPALITWVIVPVIAGFVSNYLFGNILHLYTAEDFHQDL
jgi:uncharacterized membrane protein